MSLKTAVQVAHQLARDRLDPGSIAVDATAGNGHDTLFLAQLAGETGHVYSFDIQKTAIDQTATRLSEGGFSARVTLIQDSHDQVIHYVNEAIDFALFNLGYLPGGDKSIVTQFPTTKKSAEQLLKLLKPNGLLVLVLYPGHAEGRAEATLLEKWVLKLDQASFTVQKISMLNQAHFPPYVIAIEKREPAKQKEL